MATFNLSQEDYEALVALARKGTINADGSVDQGAALALDTFLRSLEEKAGVQRYALWIRWQDADNELPPNTNFPKTWPPELSFYLEFISRPVSKQDVLSVVRNEGTTNPVNIMVTSDPAALVGWTKLDDYFLQP